MGYRSPSSFLAPCHRYKNCAFTIKLSGLGTLSRSISCQTTSNKEFSEWRGQVEVKWTLDRFLTLHWFLTRSGHVPVIGQVPDTEQEIHIYQETVFIRFLYYTTS